MKSTDIIDALNALNDDIIEEADKVRVVGTKRKTAWYKPLATAACLALIILLGAFLFINNTNRLPKITPTQILGGDGFEGIMCYGISNIVNSNPWNENAKLSKLPVYKNTFTYDINSENPLSVKGHEKEIRNLIIETAKRFGVEEKGLTFSDDSPNEEERKLYKEKYDSLGEPIPDGLFNATALIAENDEIRITANVSMTVFVSFKKQVELPEKYNLSDYSDCVKVAEYIREKYENVIAMKNPVINISGGEYNAYSQRTPYKIAFYEADRKVKKEIINYNFFETEFVFDDNGNLSGISFHAPNLSQKVGDYPIITREKAKELLQGGDYISDVPFDFPGEKYVAKTELVYQTDSREAYFMPYYKFYVELPNHQSDDGMKTFGIYYVPAVEEKYISGK